MVVMRIALVMLALIAVTATPVVFADEPVTATPPGGGGTIHKVEEGETLWTIAEKYYGDGKLWPKIWDANKDKVSNAQSLRAGDELIIPPKDGEAAAPEAASAQQPPSGEAAQTTLTPVAETPAETPAGEQPAAAGQAAPADVSSTEEASRPLADNVDLYCSFFVSEDLDDSTRFVASQFQDSKFGFDVDDLVFINKGTADGISNGMELMAVSGQGELSHPINGNGLGDLYLMLGRVRVTCTYEKTAMCTIVQACFPMELGTVLIPWKEVPVPIGKFTPTAQCTPPTGRSVGWIVRAQDDLVGLTEGHNVLIDLGSRDGVVPGDIFTIYREDLSRGRVIESSSFASTSYGAGAVPGLPRWVLGNLVVVLAHEKTSTARILDSSEDITIGDRVELQ